jgi:hypothetical protein
MATTNKPNAPRPYVEQERIEQRTLAMSRSVIQMFVTDCKWPCPYDTKISWQVDFTRWDQKFPNGKTENNHFITPDKLLNPVVLGTQQAHHSWPMKRIMWAERLGLLYTQRVCLQTKLQIFAAVQCHVIHFWPLLGRGHNSLSNIYVKMNVNAVSWDYVFLYRPKLGSTWLIFSCAVSDVIKYLCRYTTT